MRQILYLVQKEFRQIFRDRVMILIIFVVPVVQIFILGYAVTTDVVHIPVLFCDQDRTPMSRDLIARFTHSVYFDCVGVEEDYSRLVAATDGWKASAVIVVPSGFQRKILRGEHPRVQALLDGVDGNTAGIAMGYILDIVGRFEANFLSENPVLARAAGSAHIAAAEPRFWYNPELQSRRYITPGIIALILTIITVFLTSMGIVREKEIGTLEQLMVTPIRSYQLIAGKIIPFSLLGFVDAGIAMLAIYLMFGIGIAGSVPLLFLEAMLFILTTLGLGIAISTIAETQQQAVFLAWFMMIFSILLSGFFVPIANMPRSIQIVTYLNPLRYFLIVLREIYLKGSSLSTLYPETLGLVAFGFVIFSLAVLRFRGKLAHGA